MRALRVLVPIGAILVLSGCRSDRSRVERRIEDGVETILNRVEPYRIGGKAVSFRLEEEFRLDLGREDLVAAGLFYPQGVHADSRGNVFILDRERKSDHFVFAFDAAGRFLRKFGRRGQGPGELQNAAMIGVDSRDEIWADDVYAHKILYFGADGSFRREVRYPTGWRAVTPLENGGFLAMGSYMEESPRGIGTHLRLYDSAFREVKLLDFFDTTPFSPGKRSTGLIILFTWKVRNGRIYVGNEQRGYEIWVYDLTGRLLRRIRKEHARVPYPREYRKQTEEMAKRRPELYPAEETPPYNSFFVDDNGSLFIMTYEPGAGPGEYMHDIFDPDGVSVGQVSLGRSGWMGRALNPMQAEARNGRYYRLRFVSDETPDAELVVSRMIRE